MNIVFLTARYPPDILGGGEVSTALQAEALAVHGQKVTVLCGSLTDQEEERQGVRVIRRRSLLPWWGKPLNEAAVSRATARAVLSTLDARLLTQTDILHAHEFRSALTLSRIEHPRRVVTLRDYAPICGTTNNLWWDGSACDGCSWMNVLFRCHRVAEASLARKPFRVAQYKGNLGFRLAAYRRLPAHVYTSEALRRRIASRLLLPPDARTAVIANPIDPAWLQEPLRPVPEAPILCAPGRLETTKGTGVLLAAVQELVSAVPGLRLELVGGGEVERYRTEALRRGLQSVVTFVGPVDPAAVRARVDSARVIVSAHVWEEPFGRVALEAGARARPLVVSDIGGVRETTTNDTALRVPPGDAHALAEALRNLLGNLARCARVGTAGRRLVESRYAAPRIAAELLAFYQGL